MKSTVASSMQYQFRAKSEKRFLFGLLFGISILFSVIGSYECSTNALKHPTNNRLEDFQTLYEPKEIDETKVVEEEDSNDSSSLENIHHSDKRARTMADLQKVLRHFEEDKPKRIDRMKFFGALGKRSSDYRLAKKSKQVIDRMRFMGNIGK